MKREKLFFKNMDPHIALVVAVGCGAWSFYTGSKLIPIFLDCADLLNKGTPIDSLYVFFVVVTLFLLALTTYFVTIAFLLAQKRVFEELYG